MPFSEKSMQMIVSMMIRSSIYQNAFRGQCPSKARNVMYMKVVTFCDLKTFYLLNDGKDSTPENPPWTMVYVN